jgi:hypothetical protein
MNKPEKKEQSSLPPVRIRTVESRTWCATGAIEGERAIAAVPARRTLGTRTERRCMG